MPLKSVYGDAKNFVSGIRRVKIPKTRDQIDMERERRLKKQGVPGREAERSVAGVDRLTQDYKYHGVKGAAELGQRRKAYSDVQKLKQEIKKKDKKKIESSGM